MKTQDNFATFDKWKSKLVTDSNIMGGQTVFPNSRLTVKHIGEMLQKGESKEAIKEDYPYLSELDLQFAPLYLQLYSEKNEISD